MSVVGGHPCGQGAGPIGIVDQRDVMGEFAVSPPVRQIHVGDLSRGAGCCPPRSGDIGRQGRLHHAFLQQRASNDELIRVIGICVSGQILRGIGDRSCVGMADLSRRKGPHHKWQMADQRASYVDAMLRVPRAPTSRTRDLLSSDVVDAGIGASADRVRDAELAQERFLPRGCDEGTSLECMEPTEVSLQSAQVLDSALRAQA
jgi:hypothetical protein